MGGLKPDYSTIARFRDKNKEGIKKALKQCVHICMKLDLIEGNILFIDGSKFRANASIEKSYTKEQAAKRIKKIEQEIDEIVESSIAVDKEEADQESLVKLKGCIDKKEKLIERMRDVLAQLEKEPSHRSVNTTDPDAVKAKFRQGSHAAYNVQSTVDGKHGLIVNVDAVSQHDDSNQLSGQIKQAEEVLEIKPKHVVADSRYSSVKDVKGIDFDINVIVPSMKQAQEDKGLHPIKAFDKKGFEYRAERDEYECPGGEILRFKNLTPSGDRTYQGKGSVCVKCRNFGSGDNRCTNCRTGRRVTRLADEVFKEYLEGNYKKTENQARYKLRKEKVEHPFGHMKRNLGIGQFLTRGRDKVNAEASLMGICFNMARMISLMGVPKLVMRLSEV
jgi:hypothetical protein